MSSEEQRIVSTTGPLLSLEKLSQGYDFIRQLYEKILITTPPVDSFLTHLSHSGTPYVADIPNSVAYGQCRSSRPDP